MPLTDDLKKQSLPKTESSLQKELESFLASLPLPKSLLRASPNDLTVS